MTKKHLVVSAVNLVEGGTLTILKECLAAAINDLGNDWSITALVHKKELIDLPGINYIEMPRVKKSWLSRLWFEYFKCKQVSRNLKADFWLALHDMSPIVCAPRQAVYCHNAMCFYRMSFREARMDPKLLLFSLFYGALYRINILANSAIIVQQDWMRSEFRKRYGHQNIIVAHPVQDRVSRPVSRKPRRASFLYPSFPRVFKNFETLLEAWQHLCEDPDWHADLTITIDGSENRYAAFLVTKYKHLRGVNFIGRQPHASMESLYAESDCLVFPSRLETWGLPLTEAKLHGLSILAADLPYAHEAVGTYARVSYFPSDDPLQLAGQMLQVAAQTMIWTPMDSQFVAPPHAKNWSELLSILTSDVPQPLRQ